MRIHKVLDNLYYGGSIDFPDTEEGIPFGFTKSPLPEEPAPDNSYVIWNGHEWQYTMEPPPAEPEPTPQPRIISKLGFINRLGDDPYIAILSAAKTDVAVEAWLNKFNLMFNVDLEDAKVQSSVAMFVAKNLLTQEQADHVLNDPLQPSE